MNLRSRLLARARFAFTPRLAAAQVNLTARVFRSSHMVRGCLAALFCALLPALAFSAPTRALVNLSSRGTAGAAGSSALASSFTIEGSAPKAVLIRAVGPKLGALGVTGFIADPALVVFQ